MDNKTNGMKTDEVLEKFNISRRTLERKIASGVIKRSSIKIIKGVRHFSYDALVKSLGLPPELVEDSETNNKSTEIDRLKELLEIAKERELKAEERVKEEKARADQLQAALLEANARHDELMKGYLVTINNRVLQLSDRKPLFLGLFKWPFGRDKSE